MICLYRGSLYAPETHIMYTTKLNQTLKSVVIIFLMAFALFFIL